MKPWIGIVAAICGVIVGGLLNFFTVLYHFRREKELEKKKLLKSKLEESYELIQQINQRSIPGLLESQLKAASPDDLENLIKRRKLEKIPWEKFYMIVDLYLPELKTDSNELKEVSSYYSEVVAEISVGEYDNLLKVNHKVNNVCNKIIQKLVEISSKY